MQKEEIPMYLDGKHYDSMYSIEEDIPFYLECIEKYGEPVLELACGTGRITISAAEKGEDVTGLDISGSMLKTAREKASKKDLFPDLIKADMRDFHLNKKFNTILLPANTLQILTGDEDLKDVFSKVYQHLSDEGRFIFQIFNPSLEKLTVDPEEEFTVTKYEDPYDGKKIKITEQTDYDTSKQIMDLKWYYHKEGEVISKRDWKLRVIFPKEIDLLLNHCRFEIEEKYGDFDRSDFTDDSSTQILVSRKEKG